MKATPYHPFDASPVQQLPVELLDAIFMLCFPNESHFKILDDPLRQSRRVSHVCRRWRHIALLNSRLWNEITLSKWRQKDILPWIEELIHRSRKTNVSLRLSIGEGWDEIWDMTFTPLLLTLLPRLRLLDIRMDNSLLCDARALTNAFVVNTAPQLEFISITPYNVLRRPTDTRHLDFLFALDLPRLRRVEYDLNYDYIPLHSLSNVTHFKMTSCSRYGNPSFSPTRCLEILRAMPLLEEVHLAIMFNFEEEQTLAESDGEIALPHLRLFRMHASCIECAMILPYVAFSSGCTYDITCTDSEIDEAHEVVRLAVIDWAEETQLVMSDKNLELDIQSDSISITVKSPSNPQPLLVFTTILRPPDFDSEEEDSSPMTSHQSNESNQYTLLVLLARTIHRMKLTQAMEIFLNVDIPLPIERFCAPVLGPLIRACTSARRLHLTGSQNTFMFPCLLSMMFDTGRDFDQVLFADLEMDDWSMSTLLEMSLKAELTWPPPGLTAREPCPKTQALKAVHFLHTDFDMMTLEGLSQLGNILYWREQQAKLVDNLLWPVCSSSDVFGGVTMSDMMRQYLRLKDDSTILL